MATAKNDGETFTCKVGTLKNVTDEYLRYVFDLCGGNRELAAERLGVTEKTLYNRIGAPLKNSAKKSKRQPKGS